MRVVAAIVVALASTPARALDDLAAGDIARWAAPAAALGVAFLKDDWRGMQQFGLSWVATGAAVELSKRAFNGTDWGTRPDGGPNSFPSGHVASVCSAASFLQERYGGWYGAPVYAVAAVTAYSRVDHDKHHWRDVIVGCGVGVGFSHLFTSRLGDTGVRIAPEVSSDYVGLHVGLAF